MFFIGDIHGEFNTYEGIIKKLPYSIQLGDMGVGFDRRGEEILATPSPHKFIRGNHDDPTGCETYPNYLGNFGSAQLNKEVWFFVSGAYSIDKDRRIPGVSWWKGEELTYSQFSDCLELYEANRPDFVATHECPAKVLGQIRACTSDHLNPTTKAFQMMFEIHQPKLWVFAHHHYDKEFDFHGTHFVLVGTNSVFDSSKFFTQK